ncbi:MAG: hypothetical protein QMC77_08925 [Methanocellales archaeon]|nr:hypothetical protein [Methanocellales archaeon]
MIWEAQDTNCIKCHPAEGAELAASTYHQFGSGGNQACKMCHHKINTPLGEEGHAAVTTPCTFCHGKVPAKLESIHEAHRGFYLNATESSIQKGGNEACVACHTHVAFNYIATPPEGLTYDASTGEFGREPITP